MRYSEDLWKEKYGSLVNRYSTGSVVKQVKNTDMGQMWGSSRFMSPEEYELGATLDEITNIFTLGQMGFSLFTDSNKDIARWPLSTSSYNVLIKAINPERKNRYASILEFDKTWNGSVR